MHLRGLRLHGHHGVYGDEQEAGQTFEFDVDYDLGAAPLKDRLDEVPDYAEVARTVQAVSDGENFQLLETLATRIADTILERFADIQRVRVEVRKPEVQLDPPVAWTGATVERRR
jgi:dihydroneopterin aldolase